MKVMTFSEQVTRVQQCAGEILRAATLLRLQAAALQYHIEELQRQKEVR
jgi:hypothetical protein